MRITSEQILNEPVGPILARMTGPLVIAIVMMILFNAVDTYFVSRLGTVQLAAISFTFPVTYTILNFSLGLSIATSVTLAKAIGSGEKDRAIRITTDSIVLALVLVTMISIAGYLTIDPLFRMLGATDQTLVYIHQYMDIWYLFVGLMIVPTIGNSAIRATGDTRFPSIMMVISGLLNAGLDPLFIFGAGPVPALGVSGAAIATAVAWSVGFCASLWILRVRDRLLTFSIPDVRAMLKYWWMLIKMGLPISIANMLTPLSVAIMTAMIAPYGAQAVAGFGAGSRVEALLLAVCFALTAALSPYMAQNLGARKFERARTALSLAVRFAVLFQLALYPLIYILAPYIARIFSDDIAVINVSVLYLRIMPIGTCFYGSLIVFNTAFNAAHQTHKTMLVSMVRVFLCYTPMAWLGGRLLHVPGLFCGAVIGNCVAALIGWTVVKHTYRNIEQHKIFKPEEEAVITTAGPESAIVAPGRLDAD
jgi:putative MATE family efflux protein